MHGDSSKMTCPQCGSDKFDGEFCAKCDSLAQERAKEQAEITLELYKATRALRGYLSDDPAGLALLNRYAVAMEKALAFALTLGKEVLCQEITKIS